MAATLADIAAKLGLELRGEDRTITGLAPLAEAGPEQLSFLAEARYLNQLTATKAGAVICGAQHTDKAPCAVLVADDPTLAMAGAAALFAKPEGSVTGHSPLAHVDSTAEVHESAVVYPFAYIGPGVRVGEGTIIYPQVYIGEEAEIGAGCALLPGVTVMARAKLGSGVVLHPGAVVGADGFGFAPGPRGLVKIPQIGGVTLADGVEIGTNACVDKGALGDTSIGLGTKIDNLTQVGHNVRIGSHTVLAGQVGVSGSTTIGDGVQIGGQAGLADHIHIGDGVRVGAQSGLMRDVEPGKDVFGYPATDAKHYLRAVAHMLKLPALAARLRRLEKDVAALAARMDKGS